MGTAGAGVGRAPSARTQYFYDTTAMQPLAGTPTGTSPAYGISDFIPASATMRGNLNSVQQWLRTPGNEDSYQTTLYVVDSLGNTVQKTDPLEYSTYYSFADNFFSGEGPGSGLSTFAFPTTITNALSQATTIQYDYWIGRPTTITDPNQAATTAQYADTLDRLTQVTPPTGSVAYAYMDTPGSVSVKKTAQSSCGSSNVLLSTAYYDGLGREPSPVATGDAGTTVTTATTYDALDRVHTKTLPYYGSTSSCSVTYGYDALSRVQSAQNCDGSVSYSGYEAGTGNASHQAVTLDPAGIWKAVNTDGLGRTTQVIEDPSVPNPSYVVTNPLPPGAPSTHTGTNVLTTYQYDGLDDLSQVNQTSQTRTFTYDTLKELLSATQPESGTTWYTYDLDGNVKTKTDARQITTVSSYDRLNRILSRDL